MKVNTEPNSQREGGNKERIPVELSPTPVSSIKLNFLMASLSPSPTLDFDDSDVEKSTFVFQL